MQRTLLALAFIALVAQPAAADPGIVLLPQVAAQRLHYRVVRTVQGASGPQATTAAFDVVRRAGNLLVVERTDPNGRPNLSVLKMGSDGSLTLTEDTRASAVDADLREVIAGLNVAIAATRGADASAHATWDANISVASGPGAGVAAITFTPTNVAGNDFDFEGTGDAKNSTPPERRSSASGGGFPSGGGGGRGGGAGGRGGRGGGGGQQGSSGSDTARSAPESRGDGVSTAVHIAGHASSGRVTQIVITQTRSATVANMPFLNVGSWSITVSK
jgi:hypothetical protein